jgi:hypothetical protein
LVFSFGVMFAIQEMAGADDMDERAESLVDEAQAFDLNARNGRRVAIGRGGIGQ